MKFTVKELRLILAAIEGEITRELQSVAKYVKEDREEFLKRNTRYQDNKALFEKLNEIVVG